MLCINKKIDDSITYHGREIGESIVAHIQSEDSLVLSHDSKFGAYTYLSGGVANYKNQIVIDKIPVNLELMSFHLFSKDSLFSDMEFLSFGRFSETSFFRKRTYRYFRFLHRGAVENYQRAGKTAALQQKNSKIAIISIISCV